MKVMNKIILFGLSAMLILFAGCKEEFLDTNPTDQVSSEVIFQSFDGALTALNGTYRIMYEFGVEGQTDHNEFGQKVVDLNMDLMGEDMIIYSQGYGWFVDEYAYREQNANESDGCCQHQQ